MLLLLGELLLRLEHTLAVLSNTVLTRLPLSLDFLFLCTTPRCPLLPLSSSSQRRRATVGIIAQERTPAERELMSPMLCFLGAVKCHACLCYHKRQRAECLTAHLQGLLR